MPSDPSISVIIITRGRPAFLRACLNSILQAGPVGEIFVGIDGPDPQTRQLLSEFPASVRAVQLPRSCRGEARNQLAALARGRWLCFLDDDTLLPAGYFARLAALISANPDFSVFGGGQMLYQGAGYVETALYALLSSPWGAGPFTERFSPVSGSGPANPEKFILCNLTLDAEFLKAHALAFEGHLTSAEENLLLNRMAAEGAGMILSRDLNLVHRRRSGAGAFLKQVFASGRGRGQITVLNAKGFCMFTALPPFALASALACGLLRPAILGAGALLYIMISAAAAAFSGAGPAVKPAVLLLYPALHCAYALGWFCGIAEGLSDKVPGRAKPRRCRCARNS